MQAYKNTSGKGGIKAYEIGEDCITIAFNDGGVYLYDYTAPGKQHVAHMKKLADKGSGLTTYINQHVRERYAKKLWS